MKTRFAGFYFRSRIKFGWIVFLAMYSIAISANAAEGQLSAPQIQPANSPVRIDGYNIDLTLDPVRHSMQVRATVNLTALRGADSVSFELNPVLHVSGIRDDSGQLFSAERTSENPLGSSLSTNVVQVSPTTPLMKGQQMAWTFIYSGIFPPPSLEAAPEALKAPAQSASIGDPVSYLLYAAHWFPIVGEGDRFTATIHVHVPAGERVFGSGTVGASQSEGHGDSVFNFVWKTSSSPGTIVAGRFTGPYKTNSASNVRIYLIDLTQKENAPSRGAKIASIADKAYRHLVAQFGALPSKEINVVELPADAVPAVAAPELAAISARYLDSDDPSRLLVNTIAHQWWGGVVSFAGRNDEWITNGMCRYAEIEYLQAAVSKAKFSNVLFNLSASALAYDSVPMNDIARYKDFSPQFQSMTYDKGAMIFRMLQWQMGDAAFHQFTHQLLSQFDGKTISAADVESVAEIVSHQNLRPFFTQWLDSTGAPTFQDKWTLYRLGDNKGFRTIGEINQDLDLFQMPVDIRVETGGETINRRIDISGASTQFIIETPSIPHAITLDPDRWLLRNSADLQVRVHILRGMNLAADGNTSSAIQEYQQALAIDRLSSLASYRLGEIYFGEHNYQAAADAFRAALNGDGEPKWTEVWSDLQLGKSFDASGQRDRAVSQYREAIVTQDNTGAALDLARKYLEHPYVP